VIDIVEQAGNNYEDVQRCQHTSVVFGCGMVTQGRAHVVFTGWFIRSRLDIIEVLSVVE